MNKPKSEIKVAVALSGGVDSSVTLALLKNEGYDATAIFMENWTNDSFKKYGYGASYTGCTTDQDKADAIRVASHLGIPFEVWNFEKEYQEQVMKYFFSEYKAGRTPNPDIICNKEIKFGIFFDRAMGQGYDLVATGHYARIKNGKLLKGTDPSKDQSYFLCTLGQKQIEHTLFPIGEYKKTQIRQLALRFYLPTAQKKDSQGICFIGKISVADFLKTFIKGHPGDIVTTSGKVIGRHDGIEFYTIGQRHGIKIGGGLPYYVVSKNSVINELVVALGENDPALMASVLLTEKPIWTQGESPKFPLKADVVIRYHHAPASALINKKGNGLEITFDKPEKAVTPGQYAVFYKGDELIGSAVISEARKIGSKEASRLRPALAGL